MEKKKPFAQRMEAFFAGKGFYIVLALCVTVIGLSAWSMLSGDKGSDPGANSLPVSKVEDKVVGDKTTPRPAATPAATKPPVTESPAPTQTPAQPEASDAPTVTIPEDPLPVAVETYYVWPVTGEVERPYSVTALLYDPTMQDWRTHNGIDLAADLGSQVRAVSDGRVTAVREDDRYGTMVVVQHPGGLESIYANLAAAPTVSEGEQVSVGQIIGAVGDTALCEAGEACHLHFAMTLDGASVDPAEYLP